MFKPENSISSNEKEQEDFSDEYKKINLESLRQELIAKGIADSLGLDDADLGTLVYEDYQYWDNSLSSLFHDEEWLAKYQAYAKSLADAPGRFASYEVARFGVAQLRDKIDKKKLGLDQADDSADIISVRPIIKPAGQINLNEGDRDYHLVEVEDEVEEAVGEEGEEKEEEKNGTNSDA